MENCFTHLHVHSPFSFLDGGSSIESIVQRAADLSMDSIAITDHNNVSAAVRFAKAAKTAGIKAIQGSEVTLANGRHLTLIAKNSIGYANLCRILTEAHLNSERKNPMTDLKIIADNKEGLYVLSGCHNGEISSLLLRRRNGEALELAKRYRQLFGNSYFIEMQNNLLPGCHRLNEYLADLAEHINVKVVGTGNVHYVDKEAYFVHDILTCIRTLTKLDDINSERCLNAENYLFDQGEAHHRFDKYPDALRSTRLIADTCEPVLKLDGHMFPRFNEVPPGLTPYEYLIKLVYEGADKRYRVISDSIRSRLDYELDVIGQLQFEDYFLFVWDVANFARREGIRYAGRGSAADSAVAYCLFITNVDSIERGLLFERFISVERAERPDIDIDFDARYRDDVTAYIYKKYGRDHVATVCTFNRYHARSAIRDVAKVMGFPNEEIDSVSKKFPHIDSSDLANSIQRYPELRDSNIPIWKYEKLFAACQHISGFPRHMGTHLGGVVVSREPLPKITPLQMAAKGVVITQFDKDYIEDLGLIKLDLLCLRTLSAVEDSNRHIINKEAAFDYDSIPLDDKQTYELLRTGQTIGAFQVESPAQRALQARFNANNMEDIIASVALIRPGPIEGNMVEPYIARKHGYEQVRYLHPSLKHILEKTYGVILFQEQVIEIATTIAGFSPGEADKLRRTMTHFRSRDDMADIGREFIAKTIANGISMEVAETIFSYIQGYAGYGFCEAHAAAFADTAFKTTYLLTHHPAEFFASILSNEPMGFYPAHTICVEARRKGIGILGPDINSSQDIYVVENGCIRVSLRQIKGVGEELAKTMVACRNAGGRYTSLYDLCSRVKGLGRDVLDNMILAGALESVHPNRRHCLWLATRAIKHKPKNSSESDSLSLFDNVKDDRNDNVIDDKGITDFTLFEKVKHEYRQLSFSPGDHLVHFYREYLSSLGVVKSSMLPSLPTGKWIKVAGVVIRPHRPPTRSGKTVVFLSLEDEDGLVDIIVFEDIYNLFGRLIFTQPALLIEGKLERRGQGISVIASRIAPFPSKPYKKVTKLNKSNGAV